jgi:arginine exporter protein ArgO
VIPVARKVWQPIGAAIPAATARRRIIRQASGWLIGLSERALPLWPRAVRNSQPLRSSAMPAASMSPPLASPFVSNWLIGWEDWFRAASGVYLLYSGGSALLSKPQDKIAEQSDPESLFRDFASAFALTITNPLTVLVFLAIFTALGLGSTQATLVRAAILVLGVWIGSFLWWLALSLGIGTFRRSSEPHHLAWISRVSGIILFATGTALLVTVVFEHLD